MQGPQMFPLELWFSTNTDSLWAWHVQLQAGKLDSDASTPPGTLSARRRRSHKPCTLTTDADCVPPPVLVGVITGRDDDGLYILRSAADSLPRATTMVSHLDDSTLATQLCAVRALIPVPSAWLETGQKGRLERALVDCIRYSGLAVPGSPECAILGCINTGWHEGKWVWLPIQGSSSVRAAVCMVPPGPSAGRRPGQTGR
eukprot:656843-Rhodomonas_salina.2